MAIVPKDLLQPLPPEILSIIFGNLEIRDLYALSLVCSKFHETIKGNKMMFRSVYLNILVWLHNMSGTKSGTDIHVGQSRGVHHARRFLGLGGRST
jgi:hypothetical protein